MSAVCHTEVAEQLHGSKKYADLTVKCGEITTRVHKAIVCIRSEWFAKAVDDERFLEGREGVIEFKEESPRTVQWMLEYLYTGRYEVLFSGDGWAGKSMDAHLDVYSFADLLQHKGLKVSAAYKFGRMLERYFQDRLYTSLITRAYKIAPPGQSGDGLRQIVTHCIARRINKVYDTHQDFGTALQALPQLSNDIVYTLSGRDPALPITFEPTRILECHMCGKDVYLKGGTQNHAEKCPWRCEEGGEPYPLTQARGLPPRYLFRCDEGHTFQVDGFDDDCDMGCFVCEGSVCLLRGP